MLIDVNEIEGKYRVDPRVSLEENKEVEITENGEIEITPSTDGNIGMKKVTATVSVSSGGGIQPDLGITYGGLDYYYDETEQIDYVRVKMTPNGHSKCVYTTSPDSFFWNMSQDNGYKCIILNQSGSESTEFYEITGGFGGDDGTWEFKAGDKIRVGYTGDSIKYQNGTQVFSDYWLQPYIEHTVTQAEVDELYE